MEEKKEFANKEKPDTEEVQKREADGEEASNQKLVQALQIGVVVIYTIVLIWSEVRAMQKQAMKIRETQAKVRAKYEKAKYKQKTKDLKKSPKSRGSLGFGGIKGEDKYFSYHL